MEDNMQPLSVEVKKNAAHITALLNKTDNFENRLRRNNLCLIGGPEKAEGSNPGDFFQRWLARIIGKDRLSPLYTVEQGIECRLGRYLLMPRPVRILHYKDRDTILRIARDLPDLKIDNQKIRMFPDFSAEVQRRRVRDLQVSYSMIYPAWLRITALDGTQFLESPKGAMDSIM